MKMEQRTVDSIVEEIKAGGINFIHEARLMKEATQTGITQESLSYMIDVSQCTVANKIRILNLPDEILDGIVKNELKERHARAILSIRDDSMRMELYQRIIDDGLNVQETESMARKMSKTKPTKRDISDDKFFYTIKSAVAQLKSYGINVKAKKIDKDGKTGVVIWY
jgi:ParB family chromosome partitioning protein